MTRGTAMIDIPAQIGAIERDRQPHAARGRRRERRRCWPAGPTAADARGHVVGTDRSRAHRPLVHAHQRRPAARRHLPAGGQRRRRHPRVRAARTGSASRSATRRASWRSACLPDGDNATTLELEHTVPIEMAQSGAGAMWVGPAGTARCWASGCTSPARSPTIRWPAPTLPRRSRSARSPCRAGPMPSRPPGRRRPSSWPRRWRCRWPSSRPATRQGAEPGSGRRGARIPTPRAYRPLSGRIPAPRDTWRPKPVTPGSSRPAPWDSGH